MSGPELWLLETTSGPHTLAEIRSTLSQVWQVHSEVPESVRTEIEIAAGEIGANIVEHAGIDRPLHVRMEIAVVDEEVQVRFIDDGKVLDISLDTVSLPEMMAERGRGLAVARAVLRHLSYQRTADGNLWSLVSERFSG